MSFESFALKFNVNPSEKDDTFSIEDLVDDFVGFYIAGVSFTLLSITDSIPRSRDYIKLACIYTDITIATSRHFE